MVSNWLRSSCVGNIYTHQDGIRNEGAATVYKISGIAARAPNEAIVIFQKADSDTSRDPFKHLATVDTEKVTLDGREVVNTDELGSAEARAYEDLRKGVIPASRGDPCLPKITFSASSGDDVGFTSGLLSNTAANQFELEIKSAEACDLCITMEQCQTKQG